MTIKLVGAGVGRTGTHSLKLALEHLLGGTCHHMYEVLQRPEEPPVWQAAMEGRDVDWHALLDPYSAIVDFPGAAVWADIADAFPDAPVLLSTRATAEQWWQSADQTIVDASRKMLAEPPDHEMDPENRARTDMVRAMWNKFTPGWSDPQQAQAAYEAHNQAVRDAVPADRLFEYQPGDGWQPLCAALGVAVPAEPFPHTNSRDEFRARRKMDGES